MMRKDENRDKYYMPETSDQHDLYFGTRETLFTLSFSPAYDLSKNKSSRRHAPILVTFLSHWKAERRAYWTSPPLSLVVSTPTFPHYWTTVCRVLDKPWVRWCWCCDESIHPIPCAYLLLRIRSSQRVVIPSKPCAFLGLRPATGRRLLLRSRLRKFEIPATGDFHSKTHARESVLLSKNPARGLGMESV
jgi:hypothetical protein